MATSTDIPQWVYGSTWEPWYLKLIKLIRRNLCILLFLTAAIVQGGEWHALPALLFAILCDYLISIFSWVANTKPEKIFLAATSKNRDHVAQNIFEKARRAYPQTTYFSIAAATILPALLYYFFSLDNPKEFKFFYLCVLLVLNSPFAFLTFSTRNPSIEPSLTPLQFAEKHSLLRRNSSATIGSLTLLLIVPTLGLFFALILGAAGFNIVHFAMAVFCWPLVNFLYQAEYNIKIAGIASRSDADGKTSS